MLALHNNIVKYAHVYCTVNSSKPLKNMPGLASLIKKIGIK